MNPEVIRVLSNVSGLLRAGMFQGQHSQALHEAIEFIEKMVVDGKAANDAAAVTPEREAENGETK